MNGFRYLLLNEIEIVRVRIRYRLARSATQRYRRARAFPNMFFLSHARKFMFLSVSKNACSTLKGMLYELECGKRLRAGDEHLAHRHWAFREDGKHLIRADNRTALSKYRDYSSFAVYRDPLQRLLSTFEHFIRNPVNRHPFYVGCEFRGLTFDEFLDRVETILQIDDPLRIDEHLRPQSCCYKPGDLDYVVPLAELNGFLREKFGINSVPSLNSSRHKKIVLSEAQTARVQRLYRQDYEIETNYQRSSASPSRQG